MYYYGARYYDPRISIFVSVDPLAERTMTPYQYVHNNPIMFTDPTGMAADPPDGEFGQGHRHTDSDGTKWQLNGSVWENKSGGGDQWQNETLDEITIDIDRKPSKLSADLTNAYSASGFRHGVEWTKRNVSFGIYDFFHNNPAVTGYGSGEYGAYIPSARDVTGGLQSVGNGLAYAGYALTLTGIFAEVGVPLAGIGNGISTTGFAFDIYLDWEEGNRELAKFKAKTFAVGYFANKIGVRAAGRITFKGASEAEGKLAKKQIETVIDAQINYTTGKIIENQQNRNN